MMPLADNGSGTASNLIPSLQIQRTEERKGEKGSPARKNSGGCVLLIDGEVAPVGCYGGEVADGVKQRASNSYV
jgi:hypothetical protein